MSNVLRSLVIGLLIAGGISHSAQANEIDDAFASITINDQGDITSITLRNGTILPGEEINPYKKDNPEMNIIDRLPIEILKHGDHVFVRTYVDGRATIPIVPEGTATIFLKPDGHQASRVESLPSGEYGLGSVGFCPWGCDPGHGGCLCAQGGHSNVTVFSESGKLHLGKEELPSASE